ncbi:MAG: hypothetical protein J5J00_02755 [Deltaproteobacteria bacterium]|nr:hypothetical protein [Deltaproteobacteria bacterium]
MSDIEVRAESVSRTVSIGILLAASFLPSKSVAREPLTKWPSELVPATAPALDATLPAIEIGAPLLEHPRFKEMQAAEQKTALAIYDALPESSRAHLLGVFDRKCREGSTFAIVDRDFTGGSLLNTLQALTQDQFAPALNEKRDQIIESYLLELAEPGQLNQSTFGVCGTGMIYCLYKEYPAEAARLMRGLLLPSGEVNLLKRGAVLKRSPYSLLPDAHGNRSITESIMQSALMDLANGEQLHYCKICDMSFDKDSGKLSFGLSWPQTMRLFKSIYNISDDDCYQVSGSDLSHCRSIISTHLPGTVSVSLKWSESQGESISLDSRHATKLHGLEADEHLVEKRTTQSGGFGSHRVDLIKVEGDRVYFRNLHGPTDLANGTDLVNPPRRVEDAAKGIESMTRSEFEGRLQGILVPHRNRRIPVPVVPSLAKSR